MTPRRVLHCHSTFAAGGKELRAVRLMNHFGGLAEHSILSAMPDQRGAAQAIAPGIVYDFPNDAPALTGRPSVARYRALAQYMRGFDLVLTYNWGAMDAVAARRLFPTGCPPLIHHEDGFNDDEAKGLFLRRSWFRRAMLPAAQAVIVPSACLERIATRVWHQPPARVHRVGNGIALKAYGARPEPGVIPGLTRGPEDIVIGTVAGLRPVKNIPRLVAAFAQLPRHVRLVVVGEGPDRPRIVAAAQHHGVAARVLLPGHLPKPHRYLGHFDVFALSSDSEQAPISLMEAMAAGLPVAATDVGDVREMVSPENAPFIVAPETGPLAAALAHLVSQGAIRQQLGAANRARAKSAFGEAQMLADYARLYGFRNLISG